MSRLSDRAKRAVAQGGSEAVRLHRNVAEPEHVLLGLLCCGDEKVSRVLEAQGVQLDRARELVESLGGQGDVVGEISEIWPSSSTREVIERAATKADQAGHDRIEPEHVLLALIEDRGTVAKILESFGVSADAVRRDLADSGS
jgi:ATP-dependent Clp protease ATP-binding subunit ClpC